MNLSRQELAIIRNQCDDDLLFFTRFFFKELRGTKFIVSDHQRKICDQLHRVESYELELLNINIPPRFSKTELAAVNFIARVIGMNATSNWLYITASDELRSETSIRIRDIVSHPYFKIMYGVELKKDQNSKNLWRTTQGGGLKTATIFGQVTGFGAGQMVDEDTADLMRSFEGAQVWDDINKIDDSDTQNANNDKVTRTIFNTLLSRKNSSDTPIINIQQRAGLSDATEQLIEHYGKDNPKVNFMVMPVITDGIPLWNWKLNVEQINDLRTSPKTSHVFDTQYMQNPTPKEGLVWEKSTLQYYDELPPESTWDIRLGYSDPADVGIDNHSVPFAVISGGLVYVHDVIFSQLNLTEIQPTLVERIKQHKIDELFLEVNNAGALFRRDLAEQIDCPIFGLKNTTNKMSRILAQEGWVRQYFRFRQDSLPESDYDKFLQQVWRILRDGTYKKDDAPDSLAGLCFMIRRNYLSLFE